MSKGTVLGGAPPLQSIGGGPQTPIARHFFSQVDGNLTKLIVNLPGRLYIYIK
jgi:hypothetical protein